MSAGAVEGQAGVPQGLPGELGTLSVLREMRTSGRWARRRLLCVDGVQREATRVVVTVTPARAGLAEIWAAWHAVEGMGVVPLLNALVVGPWSYEVTPYYPAGALADRRRAFGAVPAELLLPVVDQVARTLAGLHDPSPVTGWRVLVHRHVTSGNLMVGAGRTPRVLLAGISAGRLQRQHTEFPGTGEFPGTDGVVEYSTPETLAAGACSPAGDWWALGMTLSELLTGEFPLRGYRTPLTPEEIRARVQHQQLPLPEGLDARWHGLLAGLLSQDPGERWAYPQVRAWLAEEEPPPLRRQRVWNTEVRNFEVRASRGRGGEPREAPGPDRAPSQTRSQLGFGTARYGDPAELAEGLAASWDAACAYLIGAGWQDLRAWSWASWPDLGRQLDQVHEEFLLPRRHLDLILCEVLRRLAPLRRATFGGIPADPGGLARLAGAALGGDARASERVARLLESGALETLARSPGCALLDHAHRSWEPLIHAALEEAGRHDVTTPDGPVKPARVAALVLGALVDDDVARSLMAAAESACRERVRDFPWLGGLQPSFAGPDGIALQVVAVLATRSPRPPNARDGAGRSARRGRRGSFLGRNGRRGQPSSPSRLALAPREPVRPRAGLTPGPALLPGTACTAGVPPRPGAAVVPSGPTPQPRPGFLPRPGLTRRAPWYPADDGSALPDASTPPDAFTGDRDLDR
jgi:hypothetical protein